MTDKITLTNLVNLQNETTAVNAINNNNAVLTTAMDNTLSRDGTQPNTMGANLDMNNNRILNLPTPVSNYEPVRLIDVSTINGGGITVSPLPAGGTIGQQLTKNSSTNFDTSWQTNQPVIAGGTTGQVLGKNSNTNYDMSWLNSVTSVGIAAPADFTITNSPVTTTGNLGVAWTTPPSGTGAVVRQTSPTLNTPNINSIVSSGSTLVLPTSSDTLVGRNTTDILTNKTINVSQLVGTLAGPNMPAYSGDVTTAAGSLVTSISSNAVTNGQLATAPAYTIKGNATGSVANPTDISIPALTQKASPVSGDFVMIADSASSNALKYATVGSLATIGSVSSIGGATGAISVGSGLNVTGTNLQDDPAMIGEVRQVAFNRIPPNFLAADGSAVLRATYPLLFAALVVSNTVTVTIASPAVMTWTGNQLHNNDPILLTTTGALPTGLATATKYYVKGLSGNTFNLSATPGGTAINTSGTQSGTHTGTNAPWEGTAIGNGTTTFTLPALNGYFIRGIDNGAARDTNRTFGASEVDAFQGHIHSASSSSISSSSPTVNGSLAFGGTGQNSASGAGNVMAGIAVNGIVVTTSTSTSTTIGVPTNDGSNGTPRTAAETRPLNQALLYIIRYQ